MRTLRVAAAEALLAGYEPDVLSSQHGERAGAQAKLAWHVHGEHPLLREAVACALPDTDTTVEAQRLTTRLGQDASLWLAWKGAALREIGSSVNVSVLSVVRDVLTWMYDKLPQFLPIVELVNERGHH
jgi:hypothetical protein